MENSVAISTIIVEKISTLSVLFFYFVFALLLNVRILLADAKIFLYTRNNNSRTAGFGSGIFSKKFKRLVLKPLASLDFKVLNLFKKYYKAIHFYRDRPSLLLYSFLMSALIQAFSVLMNYLIARGLGINLGLVEIFLLCLWCFWLILFRPVLVIGGGEKVFMFMPWPCMGLIIIQLWLWL